METVQKTNSVKWSRGKIFSTWRSARIELHIKFYTSFWKSL